MGTHERSECARRASVPQRAARAIPPIKLKRTIVTRDEERQEFELLIKGVRVEIFPGQSFSQLLHGFDFSALSCYNPISTVAKKDAAFYAKKVLSYARRGAGAVERDGLENRYTG